MEPIEPAIKKLFVEVAQHPEIAGRVCAAISKGHFVGENDLRAICTLAGIAQSQSFLVEEVLLAGERVGVFERTSELAWRPVQAVDFKRLGALLEGAMLYKEEVYHDIDTVDVVITKPPSPCKLDEMISKMGYKAVLIENTSEIFADMAMSCKSHFIIATPFLDGEGAEIVIKLFRKVGSYPRKRLVVRSAKGNHIPVLQPHRDELLELGVEIFNYWIPKEQKGTYETFHAKIVSADSKCCYVGSANMTQASLLYSMELGFFVEGRAAQIVESVCEAMIRASCPVYL